jgi:hypothetical protein
VSKWIQAYIVLAALAIGLLLFLVLTSAQGCVADTSAKNSGTIELVIFQFNAKAAPASQPAATQGTK